MQSQRNKTLVSFMGSFAVALVATLGSGCDDGSSGAGSKDVVATADAAGSFHTLVAAVGAADLTATLQSAGPFTVFAPTDAAFAKLPAGAVDDLLKPENKAKLQAVLKYHVVAGDVRAAKVVTLTSATTLEGDPVAISVTGSTVKVNDATVTMTDVAASNGVIHVIDAVLLPPSK
jgi:uncharacterized surface protein with fasciclin (FAS1) repeats